MGKGALKNNNKIITVFDALFFSPIFRVKPSMFSQRLFVSLYFSESFLIVNGMLDFSDFLKAVNDVCYLVSQDPGKNIFFRIIEENYF